jgi:hypothetical protein
MNSSMKTISQKEIISAIKQMDEENFILATAVKMVYYAGFHKNEIENIKIMDVWQNGMVVLQVAPFLKKSRKVYTTLPIKLDFWPRKILIAYIDKLSMKGFPKNEKDPLFPDPTKRGLYDSKKLQRHLKKYFKSINFDDLRLMGYERESRRLKTKMKSSLNLENEISKYSRHSRPTTTKQSITGNVQKAGKRKKNYLPWELIVKIIENLPFYKKAPKDVVAKVTFEIINKRINDPDLKDALINLLNFYMQQLQIK